jgi:dUTP pyrophosphatase
MHLLKIKRLTDTAKMPSYAHDTDSGMDLYWDGEICTVIPASSFKSFTTGIAAEIPPGFELQVRGRSGLAFKYGIIAHFGTIDEGYTGEIKVLLYNMSDTYYTVRPGDKIAQMVLAPVVRATLVEVDDLSPSNRGTNGFGSTDRE